jgi:hypothetical protein
MAKDFEKLIFGGLHEKHAVQRGILIWKNSHCVFQTEEKIIFQIMTTDMKKNRLNISFKLTKEGFIRALQ